MTRNGRHVFAALLAVKPTEVDAIVDLIAERVCERVLDALSACATSTRGSALVDAQTLAGMLNIGRETIYLHALELGGQRVGDGVRGRWRFDPAIALERWTSRCPSEQSRPPVSPAATGVARLRRRQPIGSGASLLPVRGPIGGA
jgi:hypothetical protein